MDAQLRAQLRIEISRTCKRLGGIVMLVTHDQTEVMAIADRILVMRRGRIKQLGDPRSLYEQPANRFVAEFIGPHGMNLFDGYLQNVGPHVQFVHPEFTLPLPDVWHARAAGRTMPAVTLGVRPEGLTLASSLDADPGQSVRATLEVIERVGPQVFAHFDVGAKRYVAVADGRADLKPGDPLVLGIDPSGVCLFDAVTGVAL